MRKDHWEHVYSTKPPDGVSWFQPEPTVSLPLLEAAGLSPATWIIDVGGGDSRLVDHLVSRGLRCITVLDVSAAALARARSRLGAGQQAVTWIEADVTGDWPVPAVDIWHDRALFHFLTEAADREAYRARAREAVRPGGALIVATFGPDGPQKCSGLSVVRYSSEALAAELGAPFELVESVPELHHTPSGATQAFVYNRFRRRGWR